MSMNVSMNMRRAQGLGRKKSNSNTLKEKGMEKKKVTDKEQMTDPTQSAPPVTYSSSLTPFTPLIKALVSVRKHWKK